MLPIQNRMVQHGFNPYKRQVLGVCLLLLLNSDEKNLWVHPFNAEVHDKGKFFVTYPDLCKYGDKFFQDLSDVRRSIR